MALVSVRKTMQTARAGRVHWSARCRCTTDLPNQCRAIQVHQQAIVEAAHPTRWDVFCRT